MWLAALPQVLAQISVELGVFHGEVQVQRELEFLQRALERDEILRGMRLFNLAELPQQRMMLLHQPGNEVRVKGQRLVVVKQRCARGLLRGRRLGGGAPAKQEIKKSHYSSSLL